LTSVVLLLYYSIIAHFPVYPVKTGKKQLDEAETEALERTIYQVLNDSSYKEATEKFKTELKNGFNRLDRVVSLVDSL